MREWKKPGNFWCLPRETSRFNLPQGLFAIVKKKIKKKKGMENKNQSLNWVPILLQPVVGPGEEACDESAWEGHSRQDDFDINRVDEMRSIMYRYTCGVHDMWLMRFVGPKPVTHESYSWAPHPMLSYCLAWLSVALIYTKYFPTYQSKEPVVNCWSKFKSHV